MRKIVFGFLMVGFLLLMVSPLWAEVKFSSSLSDYPNISGLERSMILNELREAAKLGIDEYELDNLIKLAKRRKISPLGFKDIISVIAQAAKLHLYPDFLLSKAKEGLLKRVREDVLVDVLEKRLGYLRTSKIIIDSLGVRLDESDKRDLIFAILQNLENELSEDVITDLINYSFSKKVSLEDVKLVLETISSLPALDISDEAILKLGEFFIKKGVSVIGMEEVVNAIILSLKARVSKDALSDFLSNAYRYKNYVALRNAILRFTEENVKNNKEKLTPTNTLPLPPPKK